MEIDKEYESKMDLKFKKKRGIYYTPLEISKFMINLVNIKKNSKILEPGCGVGNFVIPIFQKLKEIYEKTEQLNEKTIKRCILRDNIFALDTDKEAIKILLKSLNIEDINHNIINHSFVLNSVLDKFKYDIIIGNPPYSAMLSKNEKLYCKYKYPDLIRENGKTHGLFKTESFFIRKSIDLLKPKGELCFLVPNTILRVYHYNNLRKYILENCIIKKIINLNRAIDTIGYEMVILFLQKKDTELSENNIEIITKVRNLKKGGYEKHKLSQSFLKNRNIIPFYVSNDLIPIIKKIEENTIKLSEISEIQRGLPITSNDKKYLKDNKKSGYFDVLRGKDIKRYNIKFVKKYLCKSKPQWKKYLKIFFSEKILIQNLAYRIIATYDNKNHVCLDTLNILTLINPNFEYKYILGILNSELLNFYFQNLITNKARLNIHLDKPYLGELPIKKTNKKDRDYIIKLAEKMLESKGKDEKTNNEINRKVNEIYGLDKENIKMIKSIPAEIKL